MDPVSLGALVISIFFLAWTLYSDIRGRELAAQPDVVARQIRVVLRDAEQEALEQQQETLEQRIDRLAASLRESARLVEQVSAELDARAITAHRLKEEAENAEALAALNKDQADAVRRMLRAEMTEELATTRGRMTEELATTRGRIFRDTIKITVAAFVAGGLVSLVITLLVHPVG